jgi:hypothetical protein
MCYVLFVGAALPAPRWLLAFTFRETSHSGCAAWFTRCSTRLAISAVGGVHYRAGDSAASAARGGDRAAGGRAVDGCLRIIGGGSLDRVRCSWGGRLEATTTIS